MKKAEKQYKHRNFTLRRISPFLSKISLITSYCLLVLTAILIIAIPVLTVVNVPIEEMMLPPYMDAQYTNDVLDGFKIFIGNGVSVNVPVSAITLSDIKLTINLSILHACLTMVIIAACLQFISKLLKNVSHGNYFDIKNAAQVCFIALITLVGNIVNNYLSAYINYNLLKLYVNDDALVDIVFTLDYYSITVSVVILVIGLVYASECLNHRKTDITGVAITENEE